MPVPAKAAGSQDNKNVVDGKLLEEGFRADFVLGPHAADPANHGAVISAEALQLRSIGAPSFTAVGA